MWRCSLKVLVVEDDALLRKSIQLVFKDEQVTLVESGEQALSELQTSSFNMMFLDLQLSGQASGLDVLKEVRTSDPLLPVVVMSGQEDQELIQNCLELGAVDYLVKSSVHIAAYKYSVHKASVWRKRQAEFLSHKRLTEKEMQSSFVSIKGISSHIQQLKEKIQIMSKTDGPFLIQGETGTGKEIVARAIWATRNDSKRPFITVNCAEFQTTTVEGELFGYDKGAFTGAVSPKAGLFEAADGGDIFLDEIGELPIEFQAKLLRVIQEKKIRRMGSNYERSFDFRVIAATNKNLYKEANEGRFRQDLLYRLDIQNLFLEPLRGRKEDIPVIMEYFFEREGIPGVKIEHDALQAIMENPWRGNVRQLSGFVRFVGPYIDKVAPQITSKEWQLWIDKQKVNWDQTEASKAGYSEQDIYTLLSKGDFDYDKYTDHNRRLYIEAALKMADESRTEAAKLLGVSRQRFSGWLNDLRMS
jgi:DNA-binding NtrC family response regulator